MKDETATGAELLEKAHRLCSAQLCEEAIPFWEQASSLCPTDSDIHYRLGLCYAGSCRAHSLVNSAVAGYHLHRALAELTRPDPLTRAEIFSALGNTYQSAETPSDSRLLMAIDYHEKAASIFSTAGNEDAWAREQYNLGNSWCDVQESVHPEKWQRAIEHYEQALLIRTRTKDPEQHAATLQNLGTAYRELKVGDRAQNVRRSIACFHGALRALGQFAPAQKWANLHNNLGNAYLSLARLEKNPVHNARRALRHFDRALRHQDRGADEYAKVQFNRSSALLELAAHGVPPEGSLLPARLCLEEALRGFTQRGYTELVEEVNRRLALVANASSAAASLDAVGRRKPS